MSEPDYSLDRAVFEAWNLAGMGKSALEGKAKVAGPEGPRDWTPADLLRYFTMIEEWLGYAWGLVIRQDIEPVGGPAKEEG